MSLFFFLGHPHRRMNGIGIENMTSYDDLLLLESQMLSALTNLAEQMMRPLEIASECKVVRIFINVNLRIFEKQVRFPLVAHALSLWLLLFDG